MSQVPFALFLGIVGGLISLSFLVRYAVQGQFEKYSGVSSEEYLSVKELFERVKKDEGLEEISFEEGEDEFGGSYLREEGRIRVPRVKESTLLSLGITAHEIAHAVQEKEKKLTIKFVTWLESLGVVLTYIFPLFLVAGFIFYFPLLYLGLGFYGAIILICLIEIPVEVEASRKAIIYLERYQEITEGERKRLKRLLGLAILTRLTYLTVGYLNLIDFDAER